MKKIFLYMFATILFGCLTSCGGDSTEDNSNNSVLTNSYNSVKSNIIGKWQLSKIYMDEYGNFAKYSVETIYEFTGDGKYTETVAGVVQKSGTYTISLNTTINTLMAGYEHNGTNYYPYSGGAVCLELHYKLTGFDTDYDTTELLDYKSDGTMDVYKIIKETPISIGPKQYIWTKVK